VSRDKGLPPAPREVEKLLRELVQEAARLLLEYRWLHSAAYGPPSGEGTYTTGSRSPDRIGGIVGDRARASARKAMVAARERVLNATSQIREAEVALGHALPALQPRPTIEPEDVGRTISTTEYRRSQEAQARRLERGEGHGDG